jgi:hypothetical protein
MTNHKPRELSGFTLASDDVYVNNAVSLGGAMYDVFNSASHDLDVYNIMAVFINEAGDTYLYHNEILVSYLGKNKKGHHYTIAGFALYVLGDNMEEFIEGEGYTGKGFRIGSSFGSSRIWELEDQGDNVMRVENGDHGYEFYSDQLLWD